MLDPIQRRQYGIGAMILAVVFTGAAATAGAANAIKRESVVSQIAAANEQCDNNIKALGASVTRADSEITVTWDGLDGGYARLGNASAAAMSCPGWVMQSFCMGQECPGSGVKMVLQKAESVE